MRTEKWKLVAQLPSCVLVAFLFHGHTIETCPLSPRRLLSAIGEYRFHGAIMTARAVMVFTSPVACS